MNQFVVWIDSDKAQIFNTSANPVFKKNVERIETDHHNFNKKDHHGDPSVKHFYDSVTTELKVADRLFIVGPGVSKNHFKTHLEKNASVLAKKIAGLEASDHPSDQEILKRAREFFKHDAAEVALGPWSAPPEVDHDDLTERC